MKFRSKSWGVTLGMVLLAGFAAYGQEEIPPGTILPVVLGSSMSSGSVKAGSKISARVKQDVLLPNGKKIREGTNITGHVIEMKRGTPDGGSSITLAFDHVMTSKQGVPVATDLRAIASFTAVNSAMIPQFGMGEGDTWNARTTTQIGGDAVYWGGGPVMSRFSGRVGTPVEGADSGVLVRVTAAPGSPCRGEIEGNNRVQAMWVFSSDACGVYDMKGLTIAHAGRDKPVGVIELRAEGSEVKLHSGTGMLLRVIAE